MSQKRSWSEVGRCGGRIRPGLRFRTWLGARVAPQQSPILRPGSISIACVARSRTLPIGATAFTGFFQFTVSLCEDCGFFAKQLVIRRDVFQRAVQAGFVVVTDELLGNASGIVNAQRCSRTNALGLDGPVIAFEFSVACG